MLVGKFGCCVEVTCSLLSDVGASNTSVWGWLPFKVWCVAKLSCKHYLMLFSLMLRIQNLLIFVRDSV